MANMECLRANYLNTTTMITVDTGSATSSYMFDRKLTQYFESSGDNNDATTTTIRIEFSSNKNVSRIILNNINWKGFRIYYDSNTANLLTLTDNLTTSSQWTQNSETSMYLKFSTISTKIITIEATTTMVAAEEKELGELWITELYYQFTTNPQAGSYKVKYDRMEYTHTMSDGGIAAYYIQDNFYADIERTYISSTEHTQLEGLYDMYIPFVFVPEPTGTSWNGNIYEVNWVGDFDFEQFSDNYKNNGYDGTMRLRETPK